ncbi:hypothetical protein BVRB_2g045850 [Beta vulgaris subsp. vulgaris]|nr:hypothetical protein BVRB_2g045850 [Beta vulgaris subsp. vulgaris]
MDDGSVDGTKRVTFDFVKKYKVSNYGNGEAIRKGMLHSRGELLLMLDADKTTKVNDLEKLETQIRIVPGKELDLVVVAGNSSLKILDVLVVAFGSHAHLEEKALVAVWLLDLDHTL